MLDGTCRDKQVYARIAEKLGEAGYERTASECKKQNQQPQNLVQNRYDKQVRHYFQYPA